MDVLDVRLLVDATSAIVYEVSLMIPFLKLGVKLHFIASLINTKKILNAVRYCNRKFSLSKKLFGFKHKTL